MIEEQKSKSSWFKRDRRLPQALTGLYGKQRPSEEDDTNPWLDLGINSSVSSQPADTPVPASTSSNAPSRWIRDDFSPYGFADEDGTLKQGVDSTWRNAFGKKSPRRFVPAVSTRRANSPKNSPGSGVQAGSILLWQCFFAAALVALCAYVHQSQAPLAQRAEQVIAKSFSADYTGDIVPAAAHVLGQFHISVPTFGVVAAVRLHVPLNGTIQADYSANHPEIWMTGAANAPVFAAGSGTVTKLQTTPGHTIVEIDHGADGSSIYTGLGTISVHLNEYVNAGEIIGRLPASPAHSELRFSMVKNGHFENPRDFIHFPENGQ